MPTACCHRCRTPIVDYSSVVDARRHIYCCQNCAVASRGGRSGVLPDLPTCAHCAAQIVEADSLVERHAQRFCCYNCSVAEAHAARVLAA